MLQLRNIRKTYQTGTFTQTALDDVSVSFRDNEFVAVLGPSGSGKTTMLNIVGGLDHYDSGDLIIDGISTKEYKDRDWDAYRNNRIGFVFQSYNLIPHQTVLANVELALTLSGVSREERHKRALDALERVGLSEHVNKKPSQLSGGQMQRVAIARALINDPEILLADEPTGALDSKTSMQVMNLLTEIANDRLVIMVTHNPELAEQYATRIVNLADGAIRSDTDPYNPTPEEMHLSEKPVRRTSMSFLTALSLSFNNLMTKKGRTFMTAFAGSIGIIGIAAILALSNGVNDYIASVEEETLSLYPLEIESAGFDMTSLMTSAMGMSSDSSGSSGSSGNEAWAAEDSDDATADDADTVGETSIIKSMFSSISNNDLASLKDYLDNGDSGIEKYARSIEYTYDITPQVYAANTEDGVRQINPDSSFSSLGFGSSSLSSSSLSSYTMSTDVFSELPEDTSIAEEQYDVVAGHWPENYNECVIVLSSDGSITDFMSYVLGLRDSDELQDMITQLADGEDVEVAADDVDITYDDLLNLEMKLVNSADVYQYDAEYDQWIDKSDNDEYMAELINNSEDLVISGILQPKEGASITSLSTGVYYTPELVQHLIEAASQTQIVQEQLADPETDVFSGKSFNQLEEEEDDSGLDLGSMFTLNSDALSTAFTFDTSTLSSGLSNASALDLDLSSISIDASSLPSFDASTLSLDLSSLDMDLSELTFDLSGIDLSGAVEVDQEKLAAAMADVMTGFGDWYVQHLSEYSTAQEYVEAYMQSEGATEQIRQAIADSVSMGNVSEQVSQQLQEQLATQMQQQIVPALSEAVATSLQEQLSTAMQSYIQSALTVMMSQMASTIQEQVASAMEQSMSQISSNMASAMSIDEDAFAEAFQIDMDEDELTALVMSMMSSSDTKTYDSNLSTLGYADVDEPSAINIYPIDFDSKEEIVDILDAYNDRMVDEGQEDKQITYTDLVGTLMSSVTTIIDMISYVLIAFVSISLVVSSIMIGVITYISVLERRKEIGILRAIGASKGDVSRVFNAETVIEGLVSGLLGVGVTALLCIPASAIVYSLFGVPNVAQLPLEAAVVLVIISVVLTFIAGLLPASSASRKDPVEALRSE